MICPICGEPLPDRPPGPGRPRTYCSDKCRLENQRQAYVAKAAAKKQTMLDEWERWRAKITGVPFEDQRKGNF